MFSSRLAHLTLGLSTAVCLASVPLRAQHLPPGARYHVVSTADSIQLFVLELGAPNAANTYIVLHGGFGAEHSYLLRGLIPLADEYRLLLYDQRGSLRSPAPDQAITFEGFVQDVEAIRAAFGLDQVSLLAHSNGTTIALDYLQSHSGHVAGVVLMGAPLTMISGKYFSGLEQPLVAYRSALAKWNDRLPERTATRLSTLGLSDTSPPSPLERVLRRKVEYAAHHSYLMRDVERTENAFFEPRVYEALQRNEGAAAWSSRTDRLSGAIATSPVPITIINGEHDFTDPSGHVWRAIAAQVDHLHHVIIPDAGHNIWLDQPDLLLGALRAAMPRAPR